MQFYAPGFECKIGNGTTDNVEIAKALKLEVVPTKSIEEEELAVLAERLLDPALITAIGSLPVQNS